MQSKEWYHEKLFGQRQLRDILYKTATITGSVEDWYEYNTINQQYGQNIEVTKNKFYYNKLKLAMSNQKKTWKMLKGLINGAPDESSEYIEFDGQKVRNKTEMGNKFKEFYIESINEINNSIPDVVCDEMTNLAQGEFKFRTATIEDVIKVISNIKSSSDYDHINKHFLM